MAEFGPNSATSNQTLDPTVPYDPELADPDARHYQGLKRLVLQEASLISGLTLRDTRNSWDIYPPGTALATPNAPTS